MKQEFYIIGIETKDGIQKYLNGPSNVTEIVGAAKLFQLTTSKAEIVQWMDRLRNNFKGAASGII